MAVRADTPKQMPERQSRVVLLGGSTEGSACAIRAATGGCSSSEPSLAYSVDHFDPRAAIEKHGAEDESPSKRSSSRARHTVARTQAAALRRRAQERSVRYAVRAKSGAAADRLDPRSHQWDPKRQPSREPPHRLPKLRSGTRDSLRPKNRIDIAEPGMRAMLRDLPSKTRQQRFCSRIAVRAKSAWAPRPQRAEG